MRAGAEIDEVTLPVKGDDRILRQVVDQLDLVRLLALLHELDRLVARKLEALQTQLLLADLAHLGLQLFEDLRRKRLGAVKIIIKTILNRRADGELHLRVQPLHRLCEDVAGRVAVGILINLVFKCILFVHSISSYQKKHPCAGWAQGCRNDTVPP